MARRRAAPKERGSVFAVPAHTPLPPGQRVVVAEFAESPLDAIEHHMSLVAMEPPATAGLSPRDVVVAIKIVSLSSGSYST